MAKRIEEIELDHIEWSGGTQTRAKPIDEETVVEYERALRAKAKFQPIVVYFDRDRKFWPSSGFHRGEAHRRAGRRSITAEIREGSREDAILNGLKSNNEHGLRRTTEDKQHAIEIMLRHAEWGKWSNRKIADYLAVDHKTVASRRTSLEAGGEIPQVTERVGADGKTYAEPAQKKATKSEKKPKAEKKASMKVTPIAGSAAPTEEHENAAHCDEEGETPPPPVRLPIDDTPDPLDDIEEMEKHVMRLADKWPTCRTTILHSLRQLIDTLQERAA